MHVRPLSEADLQFCHDIDRLVSENPWSANLFQRGLQANHWARVITDDTGQLVAFCICLLVAGELSILNIAVHPDWQRQGLARRLLQEALEAGRTGGADQAFLEVRQSNAAAQALYTDLEFHVVGVRENYYPRRAEAQSAGPRTRPGALSGREHALIMARVLL